MEKNEITKIRPLGFFGDVYKVDKKVLFEHFGKIPVSDKNQKLGLLTDDKDPVILTETKPGVWKITTVSPLVSTKAKQELAINLSENLRDLSTHKKLSEEDQTALLERFVESFDPNLSSLDDTDEIRSYTELYYTNEFDIANFKGDNIVCTVKYSVFGNVDTGSYDTEPSFSQKGVTLFDLEFVTEEGMYLLVDSEPFEKALERLA